MVFVRRLTRSRPIWSTPGSSVVRWDFSLCSCTSKAGEFGAGRTRLTRRGKSEPVRISILQAECLLPARLDMSELLLSRIKHLDGHGIELPPAVEAEAT